MLSSQSVHTRIDTAFASLNNETLAEPFELPETPLEADVDAEATETNQEAWPFDWSSVDVPGSPGLTRLFSALKLEVASDVPPISLADPESEDSQCISRFEMQQISTGHDTRQQSDIAAIYSSIRAQQTSTTAIKVTFGEQPNYPWRDINTTFGGYNPSPFNEVYVFPPAKPATRKAATSGLSMYQQAKSGEAELEKKYKTLKRQFRAGHPAIAAVVEDLAYTYSVLEQYKKAENMFRKLVDIHRRSSTSTPHAILTACLAVVECIKEQRMYQKARQMMKSLRPVVIKTFPAHDPLALYAMDVEADLAERLGENDKAESLRRDHLQIKLGTSGPRSRDTIKAMVRLGYVCAENIYNKASAERLLQTSVQLAFDDPSLNDELRCRSVRELALSKPTKEAYGMQENAIEKFGNTLGSQHWMIVDLQKSLAWNMMEMGRLEESEKLYRTLVSERERQRGDYPNFDLYRGLAEVLKELGNFEEATIYSEKILDLRLRTYGVDHQATLRECFRLGDCYEELNRFNDSLRLYQQMIDRIRQRGGNSDHVIADLEFKISRIHQLMEQSTSGPSLSDDAGDKWDPGSEVMSEDDVDDGNVQVQATPVVDTMVEEAVEQGEEDENEDWMVFMNEL